MPYMREDDLLYGEKRPRHYHPAIMNKNLAVNVHIKEFDDEGKNITGEGYNTTLEMACRNCAYAALEVNIRPCVTCFEEHTEEIPYSRYKFDENYNPADDLFL